MLDCIDQENNQVQPFSFYLMDTSTWPCIHQRSLLQASALWWRFQKELENKFCRIFLRLFNRKKRTFLTAQSSKRMLNLKIELGHFLCFNFFITISTHTHSASIIIVYLIYFSHIFTSSLWLSWKEGSLLLSLFFRPKYKKREKLSSKNPTEIFVWMYNWISQFCNPTIFAHIFFSRRKGCRENFA